MKRYFFDSLCDLLVTFGHPKSCIPRPKTNDPPVFVASSDISSSRLTRRTPRVSNPAHNLTLLRARRTGGVADQQRRGCRTSLTVRLRLVLTRDGPLAAAHAFFSRRLSSARNLTPPSASIPCTLLPPKSRLIIMTTSGAGSVVNKRTVWRLSIFTDIFWGVLNIVYAL